MLLVVSRLALKHDLEIRELQAATLHTVLMKLDDPLVQASRVATDLFVPKSKEGHRPSGAPHVYGWAAIMTALTTNTALSQEDMQTATAYTASVSSPEILPHSVKLEPVQEDFSGGLAQVAVLSGHHGTAYHVFDDQGHGS